MFCSASAAGRSPVTTHSTPAASSPILIQSSGDGAASSKPRRRGMGRTTSDDADCSCVVATY